MATVTVSPKYQVVIPQEIRGRLSIAPGERFEVVSYDDRIEYVRIQPMVHMRGFLRGHDATFNREEADRV